MGSALRFIVPRFVPGKIDRGAIHALVALGHLAWSSMWPDVVWNDFKGIERKKTVYQCIALRKSNLGANTLQCDFHCRDYRISHTYEGTPATAVSVSTFHNTFHDKRNVRDQLHQRSEKLYFPTGHSCCSPEPRHNLAAVSSVSSLNRPCTMPRAVAT